MPRNRNDDKEFLLLSKKYGLEVTEVKRIVYSFFDILQLEAKDLPFDTPTKIFSRDAFKRFICVNQIPYIGRIGPVYSRYLLWRKNESELLKQTDKSSLKKESTAERAERLAQEILFGKNSSASETDDVFKYKRVWVVGKEGKKLARQIIPIEKN